MRLTARTFARPCPAGCESKAQKVQQSAGAIQGRVCGLCIRTCLDVEHRRRRTSAEPAQKLIRRADGGS